MTSDSTSRSVHHAAAEHQTSHERFRSFADYAASTVETPRAAAASLDAARFHAFTGEITFSTNPAVRFYVDGGVVYHAERDDSDSISRMLLDAGVIDAVQLERGVVRVGDVEHLGRLFDRDPSIDRDAVMVVVESATERIVQELASSVVTSVSCSAYRHHPSGVHRWFVATGDTTSQRPASGVAQVDRSVVDDLPALGGPLPSPLEIEWAEPDPAGPIPPPASDDADGGGIDIQAELDRFDADRADWAATTPPSDSVEPSPSPLGEFRIVWPDGSADRSISVGTPEASEAETTLSATQPTTEPVTPAAGPETPEASPAASSEGPVGTVESDGTLGFTLQPLVLDELPDPDHAVPDEVAAAVRRALEAIESAGSQTVAVPEMPVTPVALPEISTSALASARSPEPAPAARAPQPSPATPPAGPAPVFAPPTPDMRAEAVYARAAAQQQAAAASEPDPARQPADVADDAHAAQGERRGALRRLIGSLRHKHD